MTLDEHRDRLTSTRPRTAAPRTCRSSRPAPEQARKLQLQGAREGAQGRRRRRGRVQQEARRNTRTKNLDAIDRVDQGRAGQQEDRRARTPQIQAAWSKWREEQKDYSKKVSEARVKLNDERSGRGPERAGQGRDRVRRHRGHEDAQGHRPRSLSPNGESGHEAVQAHAAARRSSRTATRLVEGRWMITAIKPARVGRERACGLTARGSRLSDKARGHSSARCFQSTVAVGQQVPRSRDALRMTATAAWLRTRCRPAREVRSLAKALSLHAQSPPRSSDRPRCAYATPASRTSRAASSTPTPGTSPPASRRRPAARR